MIHWENIAKAGYEAYAKQTGNKNYRGDEMPVWKDLPQSIRDAWIVATNEITRLFGIAVSN